MGVCVGENVGVGEGVNVDVGKEVAFINPASILVIEITLDAMEMVVVYP